ncbi:hypothetical protein SLE2022_296440 [Rubroshorea leprosula]
MQRKQKLSGFVRNEEQKSYGVQKQRNGRRGDGYMVLRANVYAENFEGFSGIQRWRNEEKASPKDFI